MTMNQFAHHIIAVAHSEERSITNLQLQKIMYFTFKTILQRELLPEPQIEEVYDEPFLVWRYGPVVESVYDEYKIYGATPITEDYDLDPEFSDQTITKRIVELLQENVFGLVEQSHREEYWQDNQESFEFGRGTVRYGLDDIAAES